MKVPTFGEVRQAARALVDEPPVDGVLVRHRALERVGDQPPDASPGRRSGPPASPAAATTVRPSDRPVGGEKRPVADMRADCSAPALGRPIHLQRVTGVHRKRTGGTHETPARRRTLGGMTETPSGNRWEPTERRHPAPDADARAASRRRLGGDRPRPAAPSCHRSTAGPRRRSRRPAPPRAGGVPGCSPRRRRLVLGASAGGYAIGSATAGSDRPDFGPTRQARPAGSRPGRVSRTRTAAMATTTSSTGPTAAATADGDDGVMSVTLPRRDERAAARPASVRPGRSRAGADATVRLLAASALWLGLLLVTYWWDADGGDPRPGRLGDRPRLGRPADRAGRLGAAARPGRADGPRAAARGGVRPGPARPPAPARRLHVVQPDARPHRPDHLGVRRGAAHADPLDAVEPGRRTTPGCSWPPAARCASSSWSSPASRPPGAGSATSRGTCCTSTPTSASDWPCRTSSGPASSSCPPPAAPFFWWTAWGVAAGSIVVWRIGVPVWRNLWHRLEVTSVVRETDDVVSVYLTGRRLDRLRAEPGQFFTWRFLGRPGLDPRQPLLALGGPRRPQPADHGAGRRRRQRLGARAAAGHPGALRGTVRPAQPPGPHSPGRRPDRRRRRHHPAPGARRGAPGRAG